MLRQPLAWAAVLAALTAAERVHKVSNALPPPPTLPTLQAFPDSCDELKTGGWYIVSETGLQLQDCTIGAGTDVKVLLSGALIVRGNLTVRGNASFDGRNRKFEEACLQVADVLTVSGTVVVRHCRNSAKDGQGGCLNATSLSMEEGLLELQRCRANFAGGCAALGSLHQRAGEMRFTGCEARKYGGGLYVKGSLVQAGGQMAVTQCRSEGGGGLAAQELSTNGTISLEECSASQGGGAGVTSLRQGPAGRLECHGCRAQRSGGQRRCPCGWPRGGLAERWRPCGAEQWARCHVRRALGVTGPAPSGAGAWWPPGGAGADRRTVQVGPGTEGVERGNRCEVGELRRSRLRLSCQRDVPKCHGPRAAPLPCRIWDRGHPI
ncbi:unnamed protein product [Effrenium voratum]|uniref:Right handed beta helix domain-containing protein n=1 Tax=Effrenium voratum TaxID=2562239 RepID=A0AA36IAH0_9DINO|nr:unnamed protein product [Effrenium voratum]